MADTPASFPADLPEVLETERLLLRCPQPGDGAAVNEALRESWPALTRWMHWAQGDPPPVEDSEARQIANRADYRVRTAFHFSVYLKESGVFIAKVSLFALDAAVPKREIGYWLRTRYEGRGLMTEAVTALTAFACETLGLVRVEIRCDPRNVRSAAIPERLGYVYEGILHNDCRDPAGHLRDTAVYALRPADAA